MDLSAANFARNGVDADDPRYPHLCSDVFKALEGFAGEQRRFDLIILDPPKFAASSVGLERALHAYRKLSRAAVPLLEAGGMLLTFSCSGAVSPEAFQRAVTLALADHRRRGGWFGAWRPRLITWSIWGSAKVPTSKDWR